MKTRKKPILSLLLIVCLLVITACGGPKFQAGTYEGQGKGISKETPIRISVSIDEDGEIYEVNILEEDETPDLGGKALDDLVQQVEEEKKETVDTVSGATRTSEGFQEALNEALDQARIK